MKYRYSGIVASDLEEVQCCLDQIINEINQIINDQDVMFDLRLILSELVINSATHGNHLKKSKLIKIDVYLEENRIEISVEDEGAGIDYDFNDYDPLKLECCGRGLLIVSNLSDEFMIDKNRVRVVKKIQN